MMSQRRHLGGFGEAWALVGGILLLAYCSFIRAVWFSSKTARLRRGLVSESGGRRAGSEKNHRPPRPALRPLLSEGNARRIAKKVL